MKVSVAIFRHDTPKRGDGNRAINGGEEGGGVIAKASKSEKSEISAGHWSLAAWGSRRSAPTSRCHEA